MAGQGGQRRSRVQTRKYYPMLTALSAEHRRRGFGSPNGRLVRPGRAPCSLELAVEDALLDALEFFVGEVAGVLQLAELAQLL